jgi:hypothetical protein
MHDVLEGCCSEAPHELTPQIISKLEREGYTLSAHDENQNEVVPKDLINGTLLVEYIGKVLYSGSTYSAIDGKMSLKSFENSAGEVSLHYWENKEGKWQKG